MSWDREDIHCGNEHIMVSVHAPEGDSVIDSPDMETGRKINLEGNSQCIQRSDNTARRELTAKDTRTSPDT